MAGVRPYEQEVLDRLAKTENPLGWKPWRRTEEGFAQMKADFAMDGYTRRLIMTIMPDGIVSGEMTIHNGGANRAAADS